MINCKDCKYWGNSKDVSKLGSCGSPFLIEGYNVKDSEVPDNGANVESDEGWSIMTGPLFGCVNGLTKT